MFRGWGLWFWGITSLLGSGDFAHADEPVETTVSRKVAYCPRAGESLSLDLARPTRASQTPMLVFVHGGGWTEGSRDAFISEVEDAAQLGYIAVTIDYRLNRVAPAQIQDIRCAIRWLRSQATALGGDPSRIGIVGASAGAHLALLSALSPETSDPTEPWSEYSASVQAAVNFYGPTDLLAFQSESPNFAPAVRALFPDAWAASPIAYLNRLSPPILTMHGTADDTVSFNQALRLDRRAAETGASHELLRFPGEGHGFTRKNLRVADNALFAFFARTLGPGVKRPFFWPRFRHRQ